MTDAPSVAQVRSVRVGSRSGTWITVTADAEDEADHDRLFDATEAALAGQGLGLADAVRNRLTAGSRSGRDTGSRVRLSRLAGTTPVATSSYIDPSRFDGGAGLLLETLAVEGGGIGKLGIERVPSPPPWRIVLTGELAFVTGASSTVAGLDAQVDDVRDRLASRMAAGSALAGRPIRPVTTTMYVARAVDLVDPDDPDAVTGIMERLGLSGLRPTIVGCEGFASVDSRFEVEVDALVG
jgi:hypothetical protein